MIIYDLNVKRVFTPEMETDPPLIIDPDTPLSLAMAL
jgi:hypothetical protein